jgi:hypothetical protein
VVIRFSVAAGTSGRATWTTAESGVGDGDKAEEVVTRRTGAVLDRRHEVVERGGAFLRRE